MTRRRSPSADDIPTFGRPGFVFRECAGQAQLLEFQHRRVRVLATRDDISLSEVIIRAVALYEREHGAAPEL